MHQSNSNPADSGLQQASFPVIGMGGASGSLDAFEKFFTHMPLHSGMAFIIVLHHKGPSDKELSGRLSAVTAIPVVQAEDHTLIGPDQIYIIPGGKSMGLQNKRLLFMSPVLNGAQMNIDYFFQYLAEDQGSNAAGIIFSGEGTDGETGIRMLKEKLGLTMVQDPETAEFRQMPETSVETKMVDYILPPGEMPARLISYMNHPVRHESSFSAELNPTDTNYTYLQKILLLLRSHTGHDFTLYKKSTIIRRVERRIAYHQLNDYPDYVNFLRENTQEISALFNELLIGVTKFFRDQPAFEALKEQLYTLLSNKKEDDPLRVWIAGCSTGEEAYSVAIIILEYLEMQNLSRSVKLQVFATDLDPAAIDTARAGSYFSNISSEVSAERLAKYFIKKNETYTVKKEVREMVVFAQHNLIKDAPFTRLDLLCCRNVMIYLTTELQRKIIPVFHYSINPGGLLFLGPAESVGAFHHNFIALDNKWKIYLRKEGASALGKLIDFPFNIAHQASTSTKNQSSKVSKNPLAEHFHKRLLENYAPAALLLDEKGDILYISGDTGRFMEIRSGEAIFNIHRLAREEFKYALGNALHSSWQSKSRVTLNDIRLRSQGETELINIVVEYLSEIPLQHLQLVVFYIQHPLPKKGVARKADLNDLKGVAIEEMEKELIYTRLQLHTTIEQMETSLEELKSTNEELQSTNEELQSTNEEALTTKEEMQSLNEELMTINLQYQSKAEELTQLNNDMKNLLDNTEIGTIFLDNQLNILRFTPQVTRLFNVIKTDVGRSITHIVSNFDYPHLEETVRNVIETLSGRQFEVCTKTGEWYNLRIMPYRTMDNFISGAVVTFTKITPLKAMENKLSALGSYAAAMISLSPEATVILDSERNILVGNPKFYQLFSLKEQEPGTYPVTGLLGKQNNKLFWDGLFEGKEIKEVLLRYQPPAGDLKNIFVSTQVIRQHTDSSRCVTIMNFTE